jgi:hypothetical protein
VTAAGNFSGWAVTTGGSGAKIAMSLTLSGGSITKGGTPQNINNCKIAIEVEAGFIPQPGNSSAFALSLETGQDVTIQITAQDFAAASGLPFLNASDYLSLLRQWLAANMDQFNHVFATVDLNPQFASIPNADFSWLTPSWYSYAVAEPVNATLDNSVFAVLCLIDNTQPPTNLVQQVSNNAIPAGQKAAFLLAPGIFLKHIMFGATPLMFDGLTVSDAAANFTIDSNGTRIISTSNLTLLPLSLENGRTVHPTVNSGNFTLSVSGTELLLGISDMQFNWSPGIDIHLTYSASVSVGYDKASGHLVLNIDNQSASTPNAVTQPWLNNLDISLGVIGGIAALLGGIGGVVSAVTTPANAVQAGAQVAGGAANAGLAAAAAGIVAQNVNQGATLAARVATFLRIAAFVTLGAAVGAMPAIVTSILTAIATGEYSSVPKVADLTNSAVGKVVTWPTSVGSYFLNTAQLNGALIFVLG